MENNWAVTNKTQNCLKFLGFPVEYRVHLYNCRGRSSLQVGSVLAGLKLVITENRVLVNRHLFAS